VTCIARRNWRQTRIPAVKYQSAHYENVERDDPNDNKAIVSINTDSSSFMFRAQGHDDGGKDMSEKLVDGINKGKVVSKSAKERARTDLSLNQVENLKDALHKHLKDIRKLRALRHGKDTSAPLDDDVLEDALSGDDNTSSSDEELNQNIANVKKLIWNTRAVLRGEGEEDIQIFTEDTKMLDAINSNEDKRHEREEAIRLRKEQLEETQRV
jgi:hypothetical protein